MVCLQSLKKCAGFEQVNEVIVQPRENAAGVANWTLAAVRPRVDNNALRGARGVIEFLQQNYELNPSDIQILTSRRRR
jgi:hypothetical protein